MLDNTAYHGWQGRLRSPWLASLAIVRVALLQVIRRKSYWLVLGMGLTNFLLFFSLIYAQTQFPKLPGSNGRQNRLLERFDFSPEPPRHKESGYIGFMDRQSLVAMLLLAFSGSLLVGSDFREGSLPFYLSRRIDRRHYIVGKLLAVSSVVMILTALPALLLFLEYGMFTSSLDYFKQQWMIPLSIVGYGLLMCVVLSILLTTISAYLERTASIAIAWASLFVLLATISSQLARATDNNRWHLLDPWRNIRYVGKLVFGFIQSPAERELALAALAILTTMCCLCLAALAWRVRAVDVVE